MSIPSLAALIASVPAGALLAGAIVLSLGERSLSSFLQFSGAACLAIVVLTHVCEALDLFPLMHWGVENSAGHYLDLSSAVLAVGLFPAGYLLHALKAKGRRRAEENRQKPENRHWRTLE